MPASSMPSVAGSGVSYAFPPACCCPDDPEIDPVVVIDPDTGEPVDPGAAGSELSLHAVMQIKITKDTQAKRHLVTCFFTAYLLFI